MALAAVLIWWGHRYQGTRAAVSIAYWCTLAGILLIFVSIGLTLADPTLRRRHGGPDPEPPGHSHLDLEAETATTML